MAIEFTEEKKEGAVGALENPSVFTSTVDEEITNKEALKGKVTHTECSINSMYFQCTKKLH